MRSLVDFILCNENSIGANSKLHDEFKGIYNDIYRICDNGGKPKELLRLAEKLNNFVNNHGKLQNRFTKKIVENDIVVMFKNQNLGDNYILGQIITLNNGFGDGFIFEVRNDYIECSVGHPRIFNVFKKKVMDKYTNDWTIYTLPKNEYIDILNEWH